MRQFVMGARLQLVDRFSSPMESMRRITEKFRSTAKGADDATQHWTDSNGRLRDSLGRYVSAGNAAENQTSSFRGAMSRLPAVLLAASVALAGVGVAAVAMSNEVQASYGVIQAQTGATVERAREVGQVAQQVWRQGFGESISMVSSDVSKLNQNMKSLSDSTMQNVLKAGYVIKESFGAEFKETSKVLKTLTQNFTGLSEMKAMDMIVTGFQRGGDYADDFLDTINEYSVHFAGLGMSAEQMFATLLAGSNAGAFNLDKVGDAVKEAFIRTQDLSKTSLDAYKSLGLDGKKIAEDIAGGGANANRAFQATLLTLANLKSDLDREVAGVALFGTQWEDLNDKVILAMREGQKGLGDFEGATKRAEKALHNNVTHKLTILRREFALALAEMGQPINEHLSVFLDYVLTKMPGVNEVLSATGVAIGSVLDKGANAVKIIRDNWDDIEPFVEGVTIAFVAYGSYLGTLRLITWAMVAAQTAWNWAMTANPIGLIITGIGLLIGAGIWLYQNWDRAKAKAYELWTALENNPILSIVMGPIGMLLLAGKKIYDNWDLIRTKAQSVWVDIQNAFISGANRVISVWNDMMRLVGAEGKIVSLIEVKTPPGTQRPVMEMPQQGPKGSPFNYTRTPQTGGNPFVHGSFAVGLNRVPFDGFIAELHKDEMVLTAGQARAYRGEGGRSTSANPAGAVRESSRLGSRSVQINEIKIVIEGASAEMDIDRFADATVKKLVAALENADQVASTGNRKEML